MRFLERPNLSVSDIDIFQECIESYRVSDNSASENTTQASNSTDAPKTPDKYERLIQCKDVVETDTEKYQAEVLAGTFMRSDLPDGIDDGELARVYEETFSKGNKPGRVYYDLIRGNAEREKCPICGSLDGEINLDHYLPKSMFPTLCVMPDNLIPICAVCNKKKRTYHSLEADKRLLHLYFDSLPTITTKKGREYQETYLYAKFHDDFQISFYVKCPSHWDAMLRSRVINHMKVYGLLQRYRNNIDVEIAETWCKWTDKVDDWLEKTDDETEIDPEKAKQFLYDIVSDEARCERFVPNSWKSALYRLLELQIDDTYSWFKANEEEIKKAAHKYHNR